MNGICEPCGQTSRCMPVVWCGLVYVKLVMIKWRPDSGMLRYLDPFRCFGTLREPLFAG